MATAPPETPPIVFLSYSHDSEEQKEWVYKLACRLLEAGIDVRFDEWDAGPGDDLAKYMEKSVAESDRVIMICTEAYVRKVNDGEGGAGYEAMVVTGEIIANQATRKFIPVVRQANGGTQVPRCVSTRHYINLNEGPDQEKQWGKLIRDIHQSPKLQKPAIGTNPYPEGGSQEADNAGDGTKGKTTRQPEPLDLAASTFDTATGIIHAENFVAWRKLVQDERKNASERLLRWEAERRSDFPEEARELSAYMLEGVAGYSPVFAVALAGIESGSESFAKQLGLIDWILEPPGWVRSGPTVWTRFPETILFVYQALVGAASLHSGQPQIVFDLATTRVNYAWRRGRDSQPLFKATAIMGWPVSLAGDCGVGWEFLMKMSREWKWLGKAFGEPDEAEVGIIAYYLFLNILDFISAANRNMKTEGSDFPNVHAPLFLGVADESLKNRAYHLLLASGEFLLEMFEKNGLSEELLAESWPIWIRESNKWVQKVCKRRTGGDGVPHANLLKDLKTHGGDLVVE